MVKLGGGGKSRSSWGKRQGATGRTAPAMSTSGKQQDEREVGQMDEKKAVFACAKTEGGYTKVIRSISLCGRSWGDKGLQNEGKIK